MKKILFVSILFALVFNHTYASYNGWNLVSTRRNLTSIVFISDNKGWIFGGDIAYKTVDGGLTWSYPVKMNYGIGVGNSSPRLMYFIDSLYGWSAQYSNILLKTTNGGNYWTTVNTGFASRYRLYAVHFVNRLTGWAVGRNYIYYPEGRIIKTTNGGVSWIEQNININKTIATIYMLNEDKGFVACSLSDTLGITTNGGSNWTTMKMGHGQRIRRILFLDTLNGWALGSPDCISKTTDGGTNWITYNSFPGNTTNFYFQNNFTGWITQSCGSIYKTTNGGINCFYSLYSPGSSNIEGYMLDIFFKDENIGWASKGNGTVFKSSNGGSNWMEYINPPIGDIYSMYFFNVSTGWLTSNYSGHNYIYKTTNSGINWHVKYYTDEYYMASITFVNNLKGFVTTNNGSIYKTTNGGENWSCDSIGGTFYQSIFFINEYTGWACGEGGYVIKTTNSGVNWINHQSNVYCNLNDIYFINSQVGYIASDSGYILKSTDGGENWSKTIPYINNKKYRTIHFVNSNTGFVIGNRYYTIGYYPYTQRVVLKTTNAGLSWESKIDITQQNVIYFNNLFFVNNNTGWIIGGRRNNYNTSALGEIRKTTNGGENWFFEQNPINESFNYMKFVNEDIGWIAGDRGTVLTTNPLVGINTHQNEIPQKYHLRQNYPNPFNPVTKIGYDLVKNSYVVLKIYDLLGRDITSLVNEKQNAGSYEVEWNASGFPSGIYFYKLETEKYSEVKKMVLLK